MGLFKLVSCGRYVQWGVRRVAGARYCGSRLPQESADCGRDKASKLQEESKDAADKKEGGAEEGEKGGDTGGEKGGDTGGEKGGKRRAVVVGVYEEGGKYVLTPYGEERDKETSGKILKHLNEFSTPLRLGSAFVVKEVDPFVGVALANFGPRDAGYNDLEGLDETRENLRWGVAAGISELLESSLKYDEICLDRTGGPDAAAEAAALTRWSFVPSEPPKFQKAILEACQEVQEDKKIIEEGNVLAYAQNWARYLSDMPANKMKPVDLAQEALNTLCGLEIQLAAHDRTWIEAQKMDAFMAVARGSCEEPYMLECEYRKGGNGPTVLVVAKGLTFDSGGLCLKKPSSMVEDRGSVAGAAVALAAMRAIAELKEAINLVLVIPLCENMVSGQCMKVGDVVRALNGRSIQIEDTDMEGRLMMADALVYGQAAYKPDYVIDVATLTSQIRLAMDSGAFGCFTNSEQLWELARKAGAHTGDRPWRFPLWNYYQKQLTENPAVDLRNKGSGKGAPCLGAAFLKNFVCGDWLHMDTTGVGKVAAHGTPPYLAKGRMTGRPTRTLVHLLRNLPKDKKDRNSPP